MKYFKYVLILNFVFFSQALFAQESHVALEPAQQEVSANASEVSQQGFNDVSRGFLSRFGFFVGAIPFPVLSGGSAVSGEFLFTPWLSLTGGYERRRTSTDGSLNLYGDLAENSRTISKNTLVGLRLYNGLSDRWWKGFYLNAGYKWANLDTKHSPGLFAGSVATRQDSDEDFYAGLGYRLTAPLKKKTLLVLDVGLNYEPGGVKRVYYNANGTNLFGPNPNGTAIVLTDVGYQWVPEAKIGLRF